jgi:hypothetical protein
MGKRPNLVGSLRRNTTPLLTRSANLRKLILRGLPVLPVPQDWLDFTLGLSITTYSSWYPNLFLGAEGAFLPSPEQERPIIARYPT